MLVVERLNEIPVDEFSFDLIRGFYGWNIEDGFKIELNDNVYYVFYCNYVFMRFEINEDTLKLKDIFQVNESYRLIAFTTEIDGDNCEIVIDDGKLCLIDENNNQQSIIIRKAPKRDYDYSGLIDYVQYDAKTNSSLIIRYGTMVDGDLNDKFLYNSYLREPFCYSFVENANKKSCFNKKRSYYRLDFDITANKWQYDMQTLKEYGIDAVISRSTFSLQKGNKKFIRYYNILLQVGDIVLTGFPFTKDYTKDELEELIRKTSFNLKIPEYLIDLFNQKTNRVLEYQLIIDEIISLIQGKKLIKE